MREALTAPGTVRELFVTDAAAERFAALVAQAQHQEARVSRVTEDALAALAETVHPQGTVAVCARQDPALADLLADPDDPVGLVAVLVAVRDPGNAGTVLRTADAAGADAVVFAGDTVDPYNGKAVRAGAGSVFHLPVVRYPEPQAAVALLRGAGLQVLAATGAGEHDIDVLSDDGVLARPTAWLFGSEAHGLPAALAAAADARVRVPLHGRAESLNLGAAAAVCLYASARARREHHRLSGGDA